MSICDSPGPGPGAYKLKTLTGACDHDPTKYKNPQYSFRLKPPLGKASLTPGPYNICDLTRYGKPGIPKYTIGQKLAGSKIPIGPGPAAYSIMCDKKYPAWTIAKRVGLKLAPRSPGPAAYNLPCKTSYPAYTMQRRYKSLDNPRSPGPGQYFPCNLHVYKLRKPIYTMRPALPLGSYVASPGPAAYFPCRQTCNKTPGYTFGVKHTCTETLHITPEDNYPCFPTKG